MAARSGAQYLAGLRDGREVWYGGARVLDVTTHPAFAAAAQTMAWLYDLYNSSPALSAFIGLAELLGAAGLILPGLTKIQPRLTVWAAVGLAIIMVLAAVYHLQRGESGSVGMNAVAFALAGLVAYGRWRVVPLQAKA